MENTEITFKEGDLRREYFKFEIPKSAVDEFDDYLKTSPGIAARLKKKPKYSDKNNRSIAVAIIGNQVEGFRKKVEKSNL